MSAVDEYEDVKQDRLGSEMELLAHVIATYADAAIAELKDEVGDEWARAEQAIERLRQAEAERDALRERLDRVEFGPSSDDD